MTFKRFRKISRSVLGCRIIGTAKRNEWNVELLEKKTEHLNYLRDHVNGQKIKGLMLGEIQPKEYRQWLIKEVEIEGQANDIIRFCRQNSYVVMLSCKQLPLGDVTNTLDKVTHHLENSPLDLRHSSVAHLPQNIGHEKELGLKVPEYLAATVQRRPSTLFRRKDEMLSTFFRPSQGHSKLRSERVPAADIKSLSSLDQVHVSSQTDTLPSQGCEVDIETANVPVTVETISDGKESMLTIHEIETVPSLNDGEDHTGPGLNARVKQSVERAAAMAAMKSLPGNTRAVLEPVTSSPSRKEYGTPADGDQSVLEVCLDVKGSIKRALQEIFRYLNDVTASKLVVHGHGGIGKTTLLKALVSHPKTKSMFDVIILVTVSRYWSITKIRNEVLRELSLCREVSDTDSQVAEKLFQFLTGKKFLLLLDDVWKPIDLKAVGIPDPSSENGCKVLLASRILDVCHSMDVTKVIEVETLSTEESWELFNEQVGEIIRSSPDIQHFAQAIVKGCGCLPLLIIVTGSALCEQKDISVWEQASRKFSLPSNAGVNEDVIQLLKFSFDELKDHDVKSCFLHCALFREDREVNIFELIEYCIREGIITGTWADAHKRGRDIVRVLQRASLLQVTEGGDSLKMHDLIRDLALSIVLSTMDDNQFLFRAEGSPFLLTAYSRLMESSNPESCSSSSGSLKSPESNRLFIPEGHQFLLRAGAGLTESPLEEEWNQARMIFLMDNDLRKLPEKPNCPELSALFLQRNCRLRAMPVSFFEFMISLKVLNISKTRIKFLPTTLSKLKSLQILILRDCERLTDLPPEVGCLENLEVLDLRGTEINKLPEEIGKLAFLRHLEVSFYGSICFSEQVKLPRELIPTEIISKLHALETLSIVVYPGDQRWHDVVKSVVNEVSNLTKLSSLCFHFPDVWLLDSFLQNRKAWNAQPLRQFKFVVGHDVKSVISRVPSYMEFDYYQQGQCLRLVNCKEITDAVLNVLAQSTAFYLDHHLDVRSLSDFRVSNTNRLKCCIISECPKIEVVVNSNELTTVCPSLENLSIHSCNLTCVLKGTIPEGSFAELRFLTVHGCPEIKYVFGGSIVQLLSKLEELTVEDCPDMEEIIKFEDQITDSGTIALPNMKKLTLHYLPKLVNIWISAWPVLEYISFYDCPSLKKLGIDSKLNDTIKEIKAEKNWWDALEWEDNKSQSDIRDHLPLIYYDDL